MEENKYDLIILDDFFPNLLSSFRIAEFNGYLKKFNNSIIYSISAQFDITIKKYERKFNQFQGRVLKFDDQKVLRAKLIYLVFIDNAQKFLKFIEKNQIPFIFTLYPGGGLTLIRNSFKKKLKKIFSLKVLYKRFYLPLLSEIKKLQIKNSLIIIFNFLRFAYTTLTYDSYKKIFSSKYFKKVIVTQKIVYNFLVKHKLCNIEDIEFIYGGVSPLHEYHTKKKKKIYYPTEKHTFDICFVAVKYMEKGLDKGYDIFIEVAKLLCEQHDNINFHVVGDFTENDINISEIKNKIKFYGFLETSEFIEFYKKQDIILSPNRPFVLEQGRIDGFPTGSCVEAGANGVALFISDPLNQNIAFKNNEEIVIIPNDPYQIKSLINYYYKNPNMLYNLARKGTKKIEDIFNPQTQMKKRIELLSKYININ